MFSFIVLNCCLLSYLPYLRLPSFIHSFLSSFLTCLIPFLLPSLPSFLPSILPAFLSLYLCLSRSLLRVAGYETVLIMFVTPAAHVKEVIVSLPQLCYAPIHFSCTIRPKKKEKKREKKREIENRQSKELFLFIFLFFLQHHHIIVMYNVTSCSYIK